MAVVYILYSESIDKFYTGSCKNLKERLVQHQNKEFKKNYTRQADDWELNFAIEDLDYQQARNMEQHIKAMKSRKYIQDLTQLGYISLLPLA